MHWPKRSSTPSAPKSGKQDDHTAPIKAVASTLTMASGMLGQDGRHPVSLAHAGFAQGIGGPSNFRVHLVPTQAAGSLRN